MDLSARLDNSYDTYLAPWEKNLQPQSQSSQLEPLATITTINQIHELQNKSSKIKYLIGVLIILGTILITTTLFVLASNDWPKPIPWHPKLVSFTDQSITQFSSKSFPVKGSIIFRSALSKHNTSSNFTKHHIVTKISNKESSHTINTTIHHQQKPLIIKTSSSIANDNQSSSILITESIYNHDLNQLFINNNQIQTSNIINLSDYNNQWIAINPKPKFIDLNNNSVKSLTTLRNIKLQKYFLNTINSLTAQSINNPQSDFELTHHSINITIPPKIAQSYLDDLLNIYIDTTNDPQNRNTIQKLKASTTDIFNSDTELTLLINKSNLLFEQVYLSTQLKTQGEKTYDIKLVDKISTYPDSEIISPTNVNLTNEDLDLDSLITNELLKKIVITLLS